MTRCIHLPFKEREEIVNVLFLSLHCINLCEILSILCSHFYPILHVCDSDNAYFLIIVTILFHIDMDKSFVGRIVLLPPKPVAAF